MDMEIDPPNTKPEVQIKDDDLFKAAESGDASTFKSLSQKQLSKALSLRNEDCRSLLHVAASSSHPEVSSLSYSLFVFRENGEKLNIYTHTHVATKNTHENFTSISVLVFGKY